MSWPVRFYEGGDETTHSLCDDCATDLIEEEGETLTLIEDDDEEDLIGIDCECCTTENPRFTEEFLDNAIDELCELIYGERSSCEYGQFEGEDEDYEVEIISLWDMPFKVQANIAGSVIYEKSSSTIHCHMEMEIEDTPVRGIYRGFYDINTRRWEVEWEG